MESSCLGMSYAASPCEGPTLEQEEKYREEGVAEEILWGDHNPHSPSPCTTQGRGRVGGHKWRTEVQPRKKDIKGQGVLFLTSQILFIVNKLGYFSPSWAWFANDGNWLMISLTLSFFFFFSSYFLTLYCWERGIRDKLGRCPAAHQGQPTTKLKETR